jgi:hypothetical protein
LANNYLQFSEVINKVTPEEAEWAKSRLTEMTEKFAEGGDEGWYFEWAVHEAHDPLEGPHIWLFSEEGAEPEHVAAFVQEFLKKFRPDGCFSLTWAAFCDKLRVGEFTGGGIFVTAKKVAWFNPDFDVGEEVKKFQAMQKAKGKKK